MQPPYSDLFMDNADQNTVASDILQKDAIQG